MRETASTLTAMRILSEGAAQPLLEKILYILGPSLIGFWGYLALRSRTRRFVAEAPATEAFDLPTLYRRLLQLDQLAGFEVNQRFYEIGSVQGIQETTEHLLTKRTSH